MKRILLVLPFLAAPLFLGLRHPDPLASASDRTSLKEIQRQIGFARTYEDALERRETQLRVERALNGETPLARDLERKVKKLRFNRDMSFGKAAHLIAQLYDIEPTPSVGVSVLPGFEGKWVVWSFVVADLQPMTVRGTDGIPQRFEAPRSAAAISAPNGAVVISPRAFDNSIPMLAAHIYHERRHFEQYTTPGLGDRLSQAQREADAYSATRANADLFGLSQDEKEFLETKIIESQNAIANPAVLDHSSLDASGMVEFSKDELARIRENSAALHKLVAAENRARLEEESSLDEFVTGGLRKELARDAYEELFRWAKIACEVPDWDRGIDWGSWGDNFETVDPSLQRPALAGPAPCELHLVAMLLDARIQGRKGLPLDHVLGLVEESRQRARAQNLPPIRAVARPYDPPLAVAAPADPGAPPAVSAPSADMDLTVPPGAGDYNRCIHSRCIRWR